MTRFKRRMLIGTALVVLVLVGLVLFFYRPTRVALERAEAFRFRRMLVTRLSDQGAYRFFFVTNRRLGADDGPLEERFGNQREGVLKYGFFDTQIEPTLGLGMIINPTDWFQNEEIQLKQVQPLDKIATTGPSLPAQIDSHQCERIQRALSLGPAQDRISESRLTGARKGLPESPGLNLPRLWG
jgi:hypothetical protein